MNITITVLTAMLLLTIVSGCASDNNSDPTPGDNTTSTDTTAPNTPTELTATPDGSSAINLTWTGSTDNVGVSGYNIYRDGVQIDASKATTFSNTGLASNTTYTYTVAAYDEAGNVSEQSAAASATTLASATGTNGSNADATAPAAPTGLLATPGGPTRINLAWTASTDNVGVAGYAIYRTGAYLATSTTTTYCDGDLVYGATHTYTVAAYDAVGNTSTQSAPAVATAASLIKLPKTGQTACYDSLGAIIPCANTGQDGDLQRGVAWPDPRFTPNSDTSITDNLTGLIWAPDGNLMPVRNPGWDTDYSAYPNDGKVKWQNALGYVAKLNMENYLGHSDWRLPNRRELRSLINYSQANTATWLNTQGFTGARADYYWSSTTRASSTGMASIVYLFSGNVGAYFKTGINNIWPFAPDNNLFEIK